MRTLPDGMQAHLDSGTTSLCHCWRLTLVSGEKTGFTDHDCPLTFDGTVFEAAAGFTGSEIESSLGLSVDNLEAAGALQSGLLDDARLRAGDFDHAAVEIWRVNWSDVAQRVLVRKGHLGEVTYGDGAFQAEVRGLSHLLGQSRGRIYQHGCDAVLGDARCGVNTALPAYSRTAVVAAADGESVFVSGLAAPDDWFSRGRATWVTGAGAGRSLAIKRQRSAAGQMQFTFWRVPPFNVEAGEQLLVTAGCDRQFATCHGKFGNAVNFRGFPHMPGNDFVTGFARQGDPANTGGKRN